MLRIAMDELSPRFSVDSPRKSASLSITSFLIHGISRKSFSYTQLPDQPLKLSVRKLDGSCFDIEVIKTATIAELKEAVEAVFSHMPKKGPVKISWPHVWGHFCLCFEGQKLVTDTDYIRYYGIKDGDQLHFIRHLSAICNMVKLKSKKQASTSKQRNILTSQSSSYKAIEQESKDEVDYDWDDTENGRYQHFDNKDETFTGQNESRLANFVRGWFSYSRLVSMGGQKGKCFASRYAYCSFRKIIQLHDGGNHNYPRVKSREH
ncbi:uncharacterized protein LOC123194344 [Mangifera indica]|uniref:uncharacterized protein LOC123194344 n=1 Tax=Mangifera indica TaxID=29780 RepID=UPI001CFB4926|nr:uncharacterized protein LOC123194344 [Mangifera indica]